MGLKLPKNSFRMAKSLAELSKTCSLSPFGSSIPLFTPSAIPFGTSTCLFKGSVTIKTIPGRALTHFRQAVTIPERVLTCFRQEVTIPGIPCNFLQNS